MQVVSIQVCVFVWCACVWVWCACVCSSQLSQVMSITTLNPCSMLFAHLPVNTWDSCDQPDKQQQFHTSTPAGTDQLSCAHSQTNLPFSPYSLDGDTQSFYNTSFSLPFSLKLGKLKALQPTSRPILRSHKLLFWRYFYHQLMNQSPSNSLMGGDLLATYCTLLILIIHVSSDVVKCFVQF